MELEQSSKRLTAWRSSPQHIYLSFTHFVRITMSKITTNMKHFLSITGNLFCFISVSIVKPIYDRCNSVIYAGLKAPSLCRAVTMVTPCFPLVTQVRCSAHLINDRQKASTWTGDGEVVQRIDFNRDKKKKKKSPTKFLLHLVAKNKNNLIKVSRRNTLLPRLNLSAWLTIHQGQAAGVRHEIRHPMIRKIKKKSSRLIVFTLRFGRFRSGSVAQSNAGSPKSCGWKSSMLPSLSVASRVRLRLRLSSGTITTCMPAASPAFTPLGASSNTKHWAKRRGKTKRCYQVSLLRVDRISPSWESAWAWAEHYEEDDGIVWWNSHFAGGALLTFAVCDSSLTWPP